MRVLAQMFLDAKRDVGRSEGTLETYGSAVSAHIIPKIGGLTVAEAKPERLHEYWLLWAPPAVRVSATVQIRDVRCSAPLPAWLSTT